MNHDLVRRWDVFVYLTEYYNHRTELQHDCLKQALSRVPSAETERKKGRWIDMDDHVMCSCCGATHYGADKNYCPNCGADMRGNENE